MTEFKHAYLDANGIRFHYVTAGQGPLLLLLHGFPENWYTWRHQIPVLAEHYQVVALDLRGYGESDKPEGVASYAPDVLANDIVEIIHSLGHTKAHIVGHDFGGSIAWRTAMTRPGVVDKLVVLNCPHPRVFAKALKSNFAQMRRSWYIFFFQLPYLPEFVLNSNLKGTLKSLFRGSVINKKAFSDTDLKVYLEALQKPGALTAALNYYRAAFRAHPKKRDAVISAPTLLIWGEGDTALGKELTYNMESLFTGPFRIEYVPHCSHWVNEEQPDVVNRLLLGFLNNA